jgi:hypothetical protein
MTPQKMKVARLSYYEASYSRRFTISLVMARLGGSRIRGMQLAPSVVPS